MAVQTKKEEKKKKIKEGKCRKWQEVLTDAGNEVVKPVLGEDGILQASEVELQDARHRVDVTAALLVN